MKGDEWERAAGVVCSGCGRESFRILDGNCLACYEHRTAAEVERAERKRVGRSVMRRLYQGSISLADLRAGRV